MAVPPDQLPRPRAFDAAVAELTGASWRPELSPEPMPAPQRIAPFAHAVSADVMGRDDPEQPELGTGRLILLHDPAGHPAWAGTFRCVTFARSAIDPEMAADPLLSEVGWSWLAESLAAHGATWTEASGTVTVVTSQSFGGMSTEPAHAEIEIRASWTPALDDGRGIGAHLLGWQDLLCTSAGLPPLPDGVVPLRPRAREAR